MAANESPTNDLPDKGMVTRVALVNTLYAPLVVGGAEKSVQSLAEHLASRTDYIVSVITLSPSRQVEVERMNNVEVIRVPLANMYWPFDGRVRSGYWRHLWHILDIFNPVMAYRVYRQFRRINPDIVHTNNLSGFSPAVWLVAKLRGVVVVHTIRDYYLMARNSTLYANGRQQNPRQFSTQIFSLPKKILSPLVDAPVAISSATGGIHSGAGYFSGTAPAVIPNGVDLPDEMMDRAATPTLVFGYIGRLEESKGVDKLLQAFEKMRLGEDVRLVFAGEVNPWFEKKLEALTSAEGIDTLGWVDFANFVTEIDVLVVPSQWQEPFGRVVIEAYGYGRPVLVSDRGGLPEMVSDDTGVVFSADASDGLLKGMLEILRCVRQGLYLPEACRSLAASFSMDHTTQKYRELYKHVQGDINAG